MICWGTRPSDIKPAQKTLYCKCNWKAKFKASIRTFDCGRFSGRYEMIKIVNEKIICKPSKWFWCTAEDQIDDGNIVVLAAREGEVGKRIFALSAFIHGCYIDSDKIRGNTERSNEGIWETDSSFDGL